MDSPLSSIVVNIFMEDLEMHALKMSPCKPKMWLRYVDDVFAICIWPHGEHFPESFHQHLITQNPSIQFTMERELEGRIAFLDVQLERRGTTALTSVLRKETHTDRYLNFNSSHPAKVLGGVAQCLKVRAAKVCDDGKWWWRQVMTNVQGQWLSWTGQWRGTWEADTIIESKIPPKLQFLSYVRGVSEWIEKMYQTLGVWTVMKSASTLRSSLCWRWSRPDQTEEGCSLQGAVQGLPMCVHWRDRKNLEEMSKQAQDSSEEEWPQEQYWRSRLGEPAPGQLGKAASVRQEERGYWRRRVLKVFHTTNSMRPQTWTVDCNSTPLGSPRCSRLLPLPPLCDLLSTSPHIPPLLIHSS